MTVQLLITGGTGNLGQALVPEAVRRGYAVRLLSRRPRREQVAVQTVAGDLLTNTGVGEAVDGVDVIIHAASAPTGPADTDARGSAVLAAAARDAGVRHLIYVSIVGVDRIPLPYYQQKLAAEQAIAASGVPWSVFRATQFHGFIDFLLRRAARFPLVLPVPAGFSVQSIDTTDVAAGLCDVVERSPAGLLPDFAGPEPMSVATAAAVWKAVRGVRRPTLPVPLPGSVARAFRAGYNTNPHERHGTVRWREWLERSSQ